MLFYKCLCNIYIYTYDLVEAIHPMGTIHCSDPSAPMKWTVKRYFYGNILKKNIIQQCYRLEPNIVYLYYIVAYNYSVVYIYISIRLDSISNHMGKSLVLPDPPPSSGSGSWQCAWGYGVGWGGWNMMKPRLGPCNGGVFDNVWNGGWLISLFQLMVQ